MSDVTEVVKLLKESRLLMKKASKLSKKANELDAKAKDMCDHAATYEEVRHTDGSYLDKGYYTTTTYCSICDSTLHTESKSDGHYG